MSNDKIKYLYSKEENFDKKVNSENNEENIDDYSLSGLIMLLGIKKKLHSEHHNILFSNNYNKFYLKISTIRCCYY